MSSQHRLNLGFIPLLDCAPLVVAREQGFFAQQGLEVTLNKESSWSSIRDKVNYGILQGAQMLAPMPLAATLGIGAGRAPMTSGLTLSSNGIAITCSNALFERLNQHCNEPANPVALAQALKRLLPHLDHKPTFASVYPYSNHYYLLRDWLSSADIDPDNDIQLVAIPPVRMIDALEQGRIDGYCVGEPWNTLAIQRGCGQILATSQQLWSLRPEKVFAVSQAWAEQQPERHLKLIAALLQACRWIHQQPDKQPLLELLSLPPYLDQTLLPLLQAGYQQHWGHEPLNQQFYGSDLNRPDSSLGQQLLTRMQQAGQLPASFQTSEALLDNLYRPDLFDQAEKMVQSGASIQNNAPQHS